MSVADILNPNRRPKLSKAMKAERTVHRVPLSPNTAKPPNAIYITLPKFNENMVFVPRSIFLRFKVKIAKGHADNHLVYNAARNLVRRMKVSFGGKDVMILDRYDIFYGYHDLLTIEEDIKMGIASASKRKSKAKGGGDAKELALTKTTYGDWHQIPLSHPILDYHGVFYPHGLIQGSGSDFKFDITLAPHSDVVITSDKTKDHTYELTDMQLEYATIESQNVAMQASKVYNDGRTFYFEYV